jgi:GNAT superfamily N-acetyltransferase
MTVVPRITRFQRSDEADAIRMLLDKLPPSEREGAYDSRLARWRWQYYDNPSNPDGEPLIWVARVADAFGGMVATIPVKVRTPKGFVLGMWGVDFIVSSKMRGMGIGKALLAEWLKTPGIAFVMGWSPVSFKVAKGVGFEVVWGFTTADILLSRIGYAVASVKHRQRSDLNRLARVFWRLNPHAWGRSERGPSGHRISVESALPEGSGGLWERVSESYGFAVERNQTYLKWRFEAHPAYTYRFVCLGEPGDPKGLAICRLTDDKPPLGVVADLIVDPGREDLVSNLIDETVAFLKSHGAYAARMDLPPCLADPILARYRCSLKKDRGMIVCTDDPDLKAANILKPEPWYISRSDADEDY